MTEPPEDEPSAAHLALLALLLPLVALAEARLNALWPSLGRVQLGQIASPAIIDECRTIIASGIDAGATPSVAQAIDDVERVLIEQVKRARVLAVQASTLTQALDAIQALDFGVHRVERINDFVEVKATVEQQKKALKRNEILVWVPERNACIRCTKLAGLEGHEPPLHPNCRCELMSVSKRGGKGVIEGLKREARRSIARGFSLSSESKTARLRATEELLRSGKANLPRSVLDYARRSILNRDYAKGRDVPR